mgnify:CR=1 FL=1
MPTFGITPQRLGTATALALMLAPLPLLAQDADSAQAPAASQTQDAAQSQDSAQTQDSVQAQGNNQSQDAAQSQDTAQAQRADIPLVPTKPTWNTFHGQNNAQKYSPLDQINVDNVGQLEKVWEVHTGDVSDGSGDIPATVWSATPIFANDTLYIGTPFYRLLALDPATGEQKWSFDTHSKLEALTQPVLKNRGVAYWEAKDPEPGQACQKIVYMGTMDAQLFAQAYAYLLTPPPKAMTKDAIKRLEAIAQSDDLGAGFTLASHDMEIRGAGELLGDEQSGQMETVGYSLYMQMLDRSEEHRVGKECRSRWSPYH